MFASFSRVEGAGYRNSWVSNALLIAIRLQAPLVDGTPGGVRAQRLHESYWPPRPRLSRASRCTTVVASFALVTLLRLIPDRRASAFYTASSLNESQPGSYREDLAAVFDLLARKKIQPVIAARLPLVEAARAHELLGGSAVSGKIILTCNGA
ncbi:MAG: zinc-binding dehydrogenase [Actinobacteria bacterium]|nr:zinc-binding dehydrogenase [Actinomycetota bacterium]